MKKSFLAISYCLILLLLFSHSSIYGQTSSYNTTNWKFSNPQQFGFTTLDVDFFDNNNVLAVGSDGAIARSTDGGVTWTYGAFNFTNPAGLVVKPSFTDVHFVTATTAYAVGTNGCMAKTTDGGVSWSLVTTPLYPGSKSINAVWFTSANTGYIGGTWNTADSIPKLYVTNNGGTTWDSINAPGPSGKTRVGYINNPNLAPVLFDVTAKAKEIYKIIFTSPTTGYVCGSSSSDFPRIPSANATTCLPTGTTTSTGSHAASLVWKFTNGVLTDYSLSKERLGYTGINTNTITCTTLYGNLTPQTQTYRAMNVINDSMIVLMSFNNNVVVRVFTGVNDNTVNMATGLSERGRYQVTNYPFPPTAGPNAGPPIPNPNTLLASNPYHMIRERGTGTLVVGTFSTNFGPGSLWLSYDTGRRWIQRSVYPQDRNWSQAVGAPAIAFAPNGKLLAMGNLGVVGDSANGVPWRSNYVASPISGSFTKMEFADCNNGVATGGASINVTPDGGKTWYDRTRFDFANSFYSINGFTYRNSNPAQAYFAVSNGTIYYSSDINVAPPGSPTLDPVYADGLVQMNDVATVGNDSVWAVGYSSFSVPTASRTSKIYRSFNGGATWSVYSGFSVGSLAQNLTDIEFPTRLVGYAAGNRDTIYKTTDGGITWNKLPLPTPGVTPQITYRDMWALDANTVFLVGNGFPRKVVFRTTDGGATWTDITNNILTLGVGNLNGIVMSDINNGYVMTPGLMCRTTNGGATWTLEVPPTGCLFETGAFAPKTVPPGVSFQNRKFFVTGSNINGAPIMEYGNPANINVNSTETVVNASCTNPTGGSITAVASGAIAPYSYRLNNGAFQSSGSFTGLARGTYTLTIRDSYCGLLTKQVTVGFTDNMTLTTNNDTTVCVGAPVQMNAVAPANTAFAWTPTTGLSNATIANPVATVNTVSNVSYLVTATLNGCVRTKAVLVNRSTSPGVNAGPDKSIIAGDKVQLDGSSNQNNLVSIAWTPSATLTGANTLLPIAGPLTTTTYRLTVTDANNCSSSDDAVVTVIPNCVAPKDAFTPNGDGVNDKWVVTNGTSCIGNVTVNVYNRYGGLVFTSKNYQNDWAGTYEGKAVADGTYYYSIVYKLVNGSIVKAKGNVTILR